MAREQVKRKPAPAPVAIGQGVLVRGGARVLHDPWVMLADTAPAPQTGDVIVSLGRFTDTRVALFARPGRLGVLLRAGEAVEDIAAAAARLALVVVQFPAFRDGRGLTTARLLRERYGFKGELRAAGDVLEDQIFFMLRCGFSSFEIRARDPEAAFARAARAFTHAYQGAADGLVPVSALRRRLTKP